MKMRIVSWLSTVVPLLWASSAGATTLSVGPGAKYSTIQDAWNVVQPGDVIEVQGGQTYTGTFLLDSGHSGTAAAPITLRGMPVNGQRPILKGIGPGQYDNMVVYLNANYFVMESFEIVGNDNDTDYCLVHGADQVTLRDLVVHDCLHQAGLVGDDNGSGSLTLEYSEFYNNGSGESSHQIYMATDQQMYPGSMFTMRYCYVHDGLGGNNVKSRSERNEIDYNWIEGAFYHQLDLIGPDTGATMFPCDSDVVGNVFVNTSSWRVARIGGDGSGDSNGHYRFVNNTMILDSMSTSVIALQYTVASLEMYNNVIMAPMPGITVYDIEDESGPAAVFYGSNNWVVTGTTSIPAPWTMTLKGADPGFVAAATDDFRPTASSPLVGQATSATTSSQTFPWSVVPLPTFYPPQHTLLAVGGAEARTVATSIGAFEPTATAPGAPIPPTPPVMSSANAGGGDMGNGGGAGGPTGHGGCKCRVSQEPGDPAGWLVGVSAVGLALARRRRRS